MKTSTKELIVAISERGYITEKEINLLNRRANAGDKDINIIYDFDRIKLTEEQVSKAMVWLRNLHYTPSGKERVNSPYGYREIVIINSDNVAGYFVGFYNSGNRNHNIYIPIYAIGGMEYYVLDGKINIVG